MKTIQALREARNTLAAEVNKLLDENTGDKFTPEVQSKVDERLGKIEAIDTEMSARDRANRITAEQHLAAAAGGAPNPDLLNASTRDPSQQSDESKALRAFLGGGPGALPAESLSRMQSRQNSDIRAAMSTTTNSEGGYTTALEYQRSLEEAMKAYGGILNAPITVIRTGTGVQMQFPTADATSETGEIVGQNAAVTLGETTFGLKTLDVYKYSSKKIALPFELLQDSFIDIESYIQGLLAVRLARIQSTHFTTGTGSGQPNGIVTAATLGKTGANGQTATVTYDDLVDLEHSIDPAYRSKPGVGYMMNDASIKVVRKLKDSQNRPLFVPGYEQGNPGGAPDRLLGRPIYISQEVATMAANAKSILFGDFSKYVVRRVMDLTLFRMTDSAFTLNGQVGFVAFLRAGGNFIDVGGAVKYYANSAT